MRTIGSWLSRGAEFIVATLLATMFLTFILQIFARYILLTPYGWTLELCLILWLWIVFFGCAFVVRHREHVTFDIFYNSAPVALRRMLSLVICLSIMVGMAWALLPTWDYIDWMKIRKTTTVENPLTGSKIPLRTIFSIYALFMVALIARYAWRLVQVIRKGPDFDETRRNEAST